MEGRIVIIVGLPGSGKTHFLENSVAPGVLVVDDVKRRPRVPGVGFVGVRGFWSVMAQARQGAMAFLADVDFCRAPARHDAERWLRLIAPETRIEWIYFRNDPEQCRRNVERRSEVRRRESIRHIEAYAPAYHPPENARPVHIGDMECNAGSDAG